MFDYRQRAMRVEVFKDTLARIEAEGDLLEAVSRSIETQQFIAEGADIAPPGPPYAEPAAVAVTRNRSFEAARLHAGRGLRTAVLNFASSTSPGGGVTRGASAQEECLCRVSTLYPCLMDERMWNLFYAPHRRAGNPFHNDDIIYTKDVLVLKDDDYRPLEKPFAVDVVTCAAPNLRESASNAYNPDDGERADIDPAELLALHERRGRRILAAAAANGAQALVLGAFGCGAFRNDPAVVAQAYANILPAFRRQFRTIEFAVFCSPRSTRNYDAFRAIG